MMIYIGIIAAISLWAVLCPKLFVNDKKKFIYGTFVLLGVLIALRADSVGADTKGYLLSFYEYADHSFNEMIQVFQNGGVEVGYMLLVKLLDALTSDSRSILIFEGCIVAICYAYFFDKNTSNMKEAYICILGYLAFNLFAFQLTGVRQSIAMAICILSFESIKKKQLVKFLIIVLFASTFHTASLFFIPAYFVTMLDVKKVTAKFVAVAVGALVISNASRVLSIATGVSERYADYGVESTDSGYMFFAIMVLIFFLAEYVMNSLVHGESENEIVTIASLETVNCLISINYIAFALWCMRLVSRTAERPSLFFLPITIVLLSKLYKGFTEESQKIYYFILIVCLVVLFVYRMRTYIYMI